MGDPSDTELEQVSVNMCSYVLSKHASHPEPKILTPYATALVDFSNDSQPRETPMKFAYQSNVIFN
jgi:hypothetical protein